MKKGLFTAAAAGGVLAAVSGSAYADSGAEGIAAHSPGIASGNSVQIPVEVPVNACGNSVDVVGVGNPAAGNRCGNVDPGAPPQHPPAEPPKTPTAHDPQSPGTDPVQPAGAEEEAVLAATGSDPALYTALPLGIGLLVGGAVLYRRSRVATVRR